MQTNVEDTTLELASTLRRFWALPRATRILLWRVAVVQIAARAALAVASVSDVVSAATWAGATLRGRRIDAETLRWALAATAGRTGGTCLTQAIAARVLCERAPSRSILIIGVRRPMNPPSSADPTPPPAGTPHPASSTHDLAPDTQRVTPGTRHPARSTSHQATSHRSPEFHAWAEIDGVCVPDTSDASSFVPLMVWR
jgi:hypothetical protein